MHVVYITYKEIVNQNVRLTKIIYYIPQDNWQQDVLPICIGGISWVGVVMGNPTGKKIPIEN